ncbi:hypothetical protein [Sphingobium sp. AS12]|uniref:hypothetical protein n=1 Tax=Sphingobium sp. AS12 TaxID=2849495 RepID=UPI0020C91D43|nr:hypothetical protein [Sphingobium sp. AS12]
MIGLTAGVVLALLLTACSGADKSSTNEAAIVNINRNVAANPGNLADAPVMAAGSGADAAVAPPDASKPVSAIYGDCYLKIDGKIVLDLKKDCPIVSLHDGKGSLILNSDGEHEVETYFVYLTPNGDGTAGASWNEEPGARHAHSFLSEKLKRDGACWFDTRIRVCATSRRLQLTG